MKYHVFEITENGINNISVMLADNFTDACEKFAKGEVIHHCEHHVSHRNVTRKFWEYETEDEHRLIWSFSELCEYLGIGVDSSELGNYIRKVCRFMGFLTDCSGITINCYIRDEYNISQHLAYPFTPKAFEAVIEHIADDYERLRENDIAMEEI